MPFYAYTLTVFLIPKNFVMKKILLLAVGWLLALSTYAQTPIGKWKKVSVIVVYEGQKMDTHQALLKTRPCAANTVYEFMADGRLTLTVNNCDESYKKIQEHMWAKTKWKVEGNKITTSVTNFSVGNSYTISYAGNTMIWTDENGTTVYQKI
jgi:hypothetical protein